MRSSRMVFCRPDSLWRYSYVELLSLAYLLFMVAALAVYFVVGKVAPRFQWIILLVASLLFYCILGSWQTIPFMIATAFATWVGPIAFARLDDECKGRRKQAADRAEKKAIKRRFASYKRAVFVAVLPFIFGVLAYLKYWNVILAEIGLASCPTSMGLLLPLGISFYTFQSASYLIDGYNGKFDPQRNFFKHLLFVSWFPQIIQGPINRYDSLGVQLLETHHFDTMRARRAFLRFGFGAVKKYAIANTCVGIINNIFTNVTPSIPGSVVVFGILLYSAQQYGDFSGGIDMASATSELFGIDMAVNFRRPYFSVSLGDFWRRWHVSLGAWMRDYVFFPFALTKPMQRFGRWAGTRFGQHAGRTLPACVANILVFFIVGLWHGAEFHYIAWGLYNGIVIALSDLLAPAFERANTALRINKESTPHRVFAIARTFVVVNIGWYFDRIFNFGDSLICLKNTFLNFRPDLFTLTLDGLNLFSSKLMVLAYAVMGCVIVFAVSFAQERGVDVRERVLGWNFAIRALIYLFVLVLISFSCFASSGSAGGFMYANF